MSIENARRMSTVPSATHISKRLCLTIVLFMSAICLCGGYVLGNVARNEARRKYDIMSYNLTSATETLYKKIKRLSPKAMIHYDTEKISDKLLEIFRCDVMVCGKMRNNNIGEFVRTLVNHEVGKVITSITYAANYMDSLR